MGSGPTVVPQYYGVPWGMYPAGSIIQPAGAAGQPGAAANGTNTAQQQRRPMSPSQGDGTQYQVIPAFYDQNGSLVMTRNGGQLRLVSPASVIVNAQQGTPLSVYNINIMSLYHRPSRSIVMIIKSYVTYINTWACAQGVPK